MATVQDAVDHQTWKDPNRSHSYNSDVWTMEMLTAGTRIYGSHESEGRSPYFTDAETVKSGIGSFGFVHWGNLQVISDNPRSKIAEYQVTMSTMVPAGYTNANNVGLGGGGRQFFIAEGERSALIMATGRVFELNTIFDL